MLRKEELFHGPFLDKAPELMLIPYDERINVDPSRRRWTEAFELHERLDPEVSYGYSGHHGVTGILAATGPGIQPADVPEGSEIVQLPATILSLLGLSAEGLDGEPLSALLEDDAGDGGGGGRAGGPAGSERRAGLLRGGGTADGRAPPRPRLRVGATGHAARLQPLKPILYVAFQLLVIGWALVAHIRRDPSTWYRLAWVGAYGGVIGLDVWYLSIYAYPAGFSF